MIVRQHYLGQSQVPFPQSVLLQVETEVPPHLIVTDLQEVLVEIISELLPGHVGEADLSHQLQVMVQLGHRLPGRTDSDVGEHQLRDGLDGDGGADGSLSPATEGHPDEDAGHSEASRDDQDPEQPPQSLRGWDVSQTMDGGRRQELVEFLHHSAVICKYWFSGNINRYESQLEINWNLVSPYSKLRTHSPFTLQIKKKQLSYFLKVYFHQT